MPATPTTRAKAQTFAGVICPRTIDYGFIHGPKAAIGSMSVDGVMQFPMSSQITFQVGASVFNGYTHHTEVKYDEGDAEVTSVSISDWRDRLSDDYVYGAFNIYEESGRVWHVLPADWKTNRRIYVSRELEQFDFLAIQNQPPNVNILRNIAKQGLFSASTIVNVLSNLFNFNWTADPMVHNILQRHYPRDVNWMNGTSGAEALQQVVESCGLQYTASGTKDIYISLRGFTNSFFLNAFLNGFNVFCATGAESGARGEELDEKGRRVTIIGARNKYQYAFPCRANWNPNWTAQLIFNNTLLSGFLRNHGLTLSDKVWQLPANFHDFETWNSNDSLLGAGAVAGLHGTRNNMTIKEYIDKIVFKSYVVDFSHVARNIVTVNPGPPTADLIPFDNFTLSNIPGAAPTNLAAWDVLGAWQFPFNKHNPQINSHWPISNHLVTEFNTNFITLATSKLLDENNPGVISQQNTLTPIIKGVGIEQEEIIDAATGRSSFRVRINFDEYQVYDNGPNIFWTLGSFEPDKILVHLSLDAEIYNMTTGDMTPSFKVRTQKIDVPNLYRAFLDGNEVSVLAETFVIALANQGVAPAVAKVRADDLAKRIAYNVLNHNATNKAGYLNYEDAAGHQCDGAITSVSVKFDDESGIRETINFTSEKLDSRQINAPIVLRLSRPFQDAEAINMNRLKEYDTRRTFRAIIEDYIDKKTNSPTSSVLSPHSSGTFSLESMRFGNSPLATNTVKVTTDIDSIQSDKVEIDPFALTIFDGLME